MELTRTQAIAYVGAGGALGAGFAAVRSGTSPRGLALGVVTGVAAGGVQSYVQHATGSSELGWGASLATGAVAGVALLGGLSPAGTRPMAARGIGALIGAATGLLAPVAAGMVLAQLKND